jgi:leucyl-tRNA synthetase
MFVSRDYSKITDDIERRFTFNTAIAAVMELLNALQKFDPKSEKDHHAVKETLETIILLLSPIVPHITHTLWQALGHTQPIANQSWPSVDLQALVKDQIAYVVQVNGKLRANISVPNPHDKELVKQASLMHENIKRHIDGMEIEKIIIVPNRLVNIVLKDPT